MAETINVQIRPGVTAFFQKKTGSSESDSNSGAIPTHYIAELETTNTTLASVNAKLAALTSGNYPVALIQSSNGTFTSRNGSTSGTINTLTELFAAQATRTEWFILNLSDTNTIELHFGASGAEVLVDVLDPGEKKYRSKWLTGFSSSDLGRWSVKSLGTSVGYAAHEVI